MTLRDSYRLNRTVVDLIKGRGSDPHTISGVDTHYSERGRGQARKLLLKVIADSDRDLVLQCAPDFDDDFGWLHAFYESLGFRDSTEDITIEGYVVKAGSLMVLRKSSC